LSRSYKRTVLYLRERLLTAAAQGIADFSDLHPLVTAAFAASNRKIKIPESQL